jgi:ATP-dependent Lhr-like helicase
VAQGVDDVAESAVIARRGLAGEIEEVPIRKNPMTVLANQIVAHAMTHATGEPDALFAAVRRTWVFRDLARPEFDRVAAFLGDVRTIAVREGRLRKSARTIEHYFENISMIPDEKTYRVVDITTRRHVGQLDEAFVANFSDQRMPFIVKGNPWRIVDIEGDQILVEPVPQVGVVPSWVGEEIPVPFDVAREVGALRRKRDFDSYPIDASCIASLSEKLSEQDGKKLDMPDDSTIVVETDGGLMVVNACLGTKVNETLGRLLASLSAARSGESVGMHVDPYRIVLEFPWKADAKAAIGILKGTEPAAVGPLVRLATRRSLTFKWRFVQAAKKFGVVSRDADYRTMNLDSLVEAYEGSPLVDEALNRTVWDEMDVARATDVLAKVRSGEIKVVEGRLSPLGILGIEESGELVAPSRPSKAILDALRKRLEEEEVRLVCLNCRKTSRSKVMRLPDKVKCIYCGARQVAALGVREESKLKLLTKSLPTEAERKELRRIGKNADLVREHGRRAALVLCGRGIGPDAAARILQRYNATDDDLLARILEAEVQFAKTKRFWD